jgi:hypothetical protein
LSCSENSCPNLIRDVTDIDDPTRTNALIENDDPVIASPVKLKLAPPRWCLKTDKPLPNLAIARTDALLATQPKSNNDSELWHWNLPTIDRPEPVLLKLLILQEDPDPIALIALNAPCSLPHPVTETAVPHLT